MTIQESRPFIVACAAFLILVVLAVLYGGMPLAIGGRADLRQLYTAGYMVRTGQSSCLYDYESQRRMQSALVSPEAVALPFDHPAYEALLFAPLALLGYHSAYEAFFFLNFVMLAVSVRILWRRFGNLAVIWRPLPGVIVLCFLPIAIALMQGQDSILLLTLMAAASASSESEHETLTGMFTGLGLFKFQFTIPIAILFAFWRRWRFVKGFMITGALVSLVSAFIAGRAGLLNYARLLLSVSSGLSTSAEQFRFGVYPSAMANLRGLCYALFHFSARAGQIATLLASMAALIYAARKRCSFALAVLTAALVSYHGLIHDMSILIIPVGAMLSDGWTEFDVRRIALAVLLLTLPTVLFLSGSAYFLLTIPLLAALTLGFREPVGQPVSFISCG